jgi:predicted anti-sigma-YlaC factor YlaD
VAGTVRAVAATSVLVETISCGETRELISAAADDELAVGEERLLAAHLDTCRSCARYADEMAALTRSLRLRPVGPEPDLAARMLAGTGRLRLGRGGWLRPALVWVGVVVAFQSIGPLVFGELDGTPTHIARHVGASALALAIGLWYAAWRPQRALGLLPLVAALFASTLVAAALDTLAGDRRPTAEVVHVAELVGMVLLWLVAGSPGWERLGDALRSVRRGAGVPHATR